MVDAVDVILSHKEDVAVITIAPYKFPTGSEPEFGRVPSGAAVLEVSSVGFPRFKLRTEAPRGALGGKGIWKYRDACQIVGRVPVLSNTKEGTLELITDPPARDLDSNRSPWEGMSGAAVWVNDRIIGIVSKHHSSDGLGRLSVTPLLPRGQSESLGVLADLLSASEVKARLTDTVSISASASTAAGYSAQLRDIAPAVLVDREAEVAELTRFFASGQAYAWWQAGPWAGKTALSSWIALHPPIGISVISFFITSRFAGQADSNAYTDSLIEQCAVIAGQVWSVPDTTSARNRERLRLLEAAIERTKKEGRRLVLIVDGLDEDRTIRAGPDPLPSIASLLPRRVPDSLRVLVTSRPQPALPDDVPPDHPIRACVPRMLNPSPHAKNLETMARWELGQRLNSGDRNQIDIVAFVAASGGGLTKSDLAELMQVPTYSVAALLGTEFGRTIGGRSASDLTKETSSTDQAYVFTHETLRQIAETHLAGDLEPYRARIRSWAQLWAGYGWPLKTPRYLLRPYGLLLATAGEVDTLASLAVDLKRQDRMLHSDGTDANALDEIVRCQQLLLAQPESNLLTLGRLAVAQFRLHSRNQDFPPVLSAVWMILGHSVRAEQCARAIADPVKRAAALAEVAAAIQKSEPERSRLLVADAERGALAIQNVPEQVEALAQVMRAIATVDPDLAIQLLMIAERAIESIRSPYAKARSLGDLAALTPKALGASAGLVLERAEHSAEVLEDAHLSAEALTLLARRLAWNGHPDAVRIAREIANRLDRAKALASISADLTDVDSVLSEATASEAVALAKAMDDSSRPWAIARRRCYWTRATRRRATPGR